MSTTKQLFGLQARNFQKFPMSIVESSDSRNLSGFEGRFLFGLPIWT